MTHNCMCQEQPGQLLSVPEQTVCLLTAMSVYARPRPQSSFQSKDELHENMGDTPRDVV